MNLFTFYIILKKHSMRNSELIILYLTEAVSKFLKM